MRNGGLMVMIMGVMLVGLMCQFSPDDLTPKPSAADKEARQARHSEQAKRLAPNHSPYTDKELAPYREIQDGIERDIAAGYNPPPIGEEEEGEAQVRVLANCRAGFTDERAPATGSGTVGCKELEQEATQ